MAEDIEKLNLDNLKADEEPLFDKKIIEEVENTDTPPNFASEEWHDYVMRQFADDELDDGKPFRDGLVRVTEKLIGPISSREIISFSPANEQNGHTATVHIRLKIGVDNPIHPLNDLFLIEDGIAEVNTRNTPSPYNLHPSATAASKAEAQALRKVLRLRKVVAADEVTPDDMVAEEVYIPDNPIQDEQIIVLDLLCKRINISLLEFINSGETKYSSVGQISDSKAKSMIKFLNQIQSGKAKSPVTKVYDPSWREKNK